MCGRLAIEAPPKLVKEYFSLFETPKFSYNYNVAPTQEVQTVFCDKIYERRMMPMRWGFIPPWYKEGKIKVSPINARLETITSNQMFKQAFITNRCLIPASGYYEWQLTKDGKQPHYITDKDNPLVAFAGVWSKVSILDTDIFSMAIVTMAPLHRFATYMIEHLL